MNIAISEATHSQQATLRSDSARAMRPRGIYDLTLPELEARVLDRGLPAYRARQSGAGPTRQLVTDYSEMVNIPAALRRALATEAPISLLKLYAASQRTMEKRSRRSTGLGDGQVLETVLMLYPNPPPSASRARSDVPSVAPFCATGLMGLARNLGAGEMVAQVVGAAREARLRGRDLNNIVMMGMGEPLQNYAETMKFINIVHDPDGLDIGARRITISTSESPRRSTPSPKSPCNSIWPSRCMLRAMNCGRNWFPQSALPHRDVDGSS